MAEAVAACVEQYLEWMEAKGYACSTVRTRRTHLQAFARWLDGRGFESLASVGRADIESYRVELFNYRRRAGLALGWGSLTQPLLAVRGFCRWLTLTERLPFNPAADMELPKRGRRVPRRVLSARVMKRVLGVPDVKSDLGLRNRVILEVLYSTGIRRAECARLHTSDLDFERGVVLIRDGKGTRDRFVPIGRRATLWVRQYLRRTSRNLEARHAGPLFLTQTGTPISVKRLGTIVHEIMLQAGIVGGGSCHLVRHSTATLMLEGGADIRDLQEFLGHAQLSTTAIYARVSIARLQNVHRRTHPAW